MTADHIRISESTGKKEIIMGQITVDQSHAVMAILVQNADWETIDFDAGLQDGIIRNPKEAGRQFTLFLKRGGRVDAGSAIATRSIYGVEETALLRPVERLVASDEDVLYEDAFFQNRKGEIWVSPSFRETFGSTFRKSHASDRKYVACELKQNASDTAIRADLPKSHLSELGDIARLIKGGTLSKDHVYVAYVAGKNGVVFAVDVHWDAGDCEWNVSVWGLDESGGWDAVCRVFCPSNAAL